MNENIYGIVFAGDKFGVHCALVYEDDMLYTFERYSLDNAYDFYEARKMALLQLVLKIIMSDYWGARIGNKLSPAKVISIKDASWFFRYSC